jgi:hypothetical protein
MWRITVAAFFFTMLHETAGAQTPASSAPGSTSIWPAVIAVCGVIFSAIFSAIISYVLAKITATNTVKAENLKRQSELALKISDLVSASDQDARRSAMRRFAVAIVRVIEPEGRKEHGMVYFIPMNSRVTVGRSDDNDIVLSADARALSRWHCGFIADQHSVWIDDYKSLNGTLVNGTAISGSRLLNNDDVIEVGPFKLHFKAIRENTILSQ